MSEYDDRIASAGSSIAGSRTSTYRTESGYEIVDGDPSTLAASAGASLDVYSLARMVASEGYRGAGPGAWLAVAETTRNRAAQLGVSVHSLLTRSKVPEARGRYSEQAARKWASTRVDPRGHHLEAARIAMEEGSQTARGATDFFDPTSQNSGMQNGHRLRLNAEQYIAQRNAAGLYFVGEIDGVDSDHLYLLGPGGGSDAPFDAATADEAVDIISEQRATGDDDLEAEDLLIGFAVALVALHFFGKA